MSMARVLARMFQKGKHGLDGVGNTQGSFLRKVFHHLGENQDQWRVISRILGTKWQEKPAVMLMHIHGLVT